MLRTRFVLPALLLALLAPCAPTLAQSAPPRTTPEPGSGANAPTAEPNYVTNKEFATKLFEVKNRDVMTLVPALRTLGSGSRGALVEGHRELKTISVRDYPENIAAIGEALARLDTPVAASPEIELRLHVLMATNVERPGGTLPAELEPVVKQLRSTFRYKGYSLVTSIVGRTREGARNSGNEGWADFGNSAPEAPYQYICNFGLVTLGPRAQDASGASKPTEISLSEFKFEIASRSNGQGARVSTDLNIREGEQVVVGTAALVDRGLILVLSAKLLD